MRYGDVGKLNHRRMLISIGDSTAGCRQGSGLNPRTEIV
jgi:hypothetical protein